jgi:hypothetical protein
MVDDRKLVLEYDGKRGANERQGGRVIAFFWLGIIVGAIVAGVLILRSESGFHKLDKTIKIAVIQTGGLGIAHLIPATFGLALGVWLRLKGQGAVHYRGLWAPLLWGCVGGFVASILILSAWVWFVFILAYSLVAGLCQCTQAREDETESAILRRRYQRYWVVTGAVMALLLASGYASAWVSREACEQKLARKVAVEIYSGKAFKLRPNAAEDAERIFRTGGYPILPADRENRYPWGDVGDTRIEFPFVVSVEYGWVAAPTYGGGMRVRYICLFGLVIEYGTYEKWMT